MPRTTHTTLSKLCQEIRYERLMQCTHLAYVIITSNQRNSHCQLLTFSTSMHFRFSTLPTQLIVYRPTRTGISFSVHRTFVQLLSMYVAFNIYSNFLSFYMYFVYICTINK